MRLSYWEREEWFSGVDLVVAGAGIVGLNAAIEAKRLNPSKKVLVIEKGPIPHGASTRNAGFACFGSLSEIAADFKAHGEENAIKLIKKRWEGLHYLRTLLGDQAIGYENQGGYELVTSEDAFQDQMQIAGILNRSLRNIIGEDVYRQADHLIERFGFKGIKHLTWTPYEGQINTGRMMTALYREAIAHGVLVLTAHEITAFSETSTGVDIQLNQDFIFNAGRMIVAVNGFAAQLLNLQDVQPARAQVLITQPIPDLKPVGCFHLDEGFYYFRNVGNRLLLGGGRNLDFKGEETTDTLTTPLIQNRLDQLLKEMILPGTPYTTDMRWAGIMGVGTEKSPIIRYYSDHIICAVRLGGMGVAIGSLTGKEAAGLL